MSLAEYLAKNYLTADPQPKKKSKRQKWGKDASSSGLVVQDDDISGWNDNAANDEEDGPVIASDKSTEFRKAKRSQWQAVGVPTSSATDQAAADAIIASAEAESKARAQAEEDGPVVDTSHIIKMESGAHAGLQRASDVAAQFRRESEAISGKNQETIYRDASGRRIDVAMKRAEARQKLEEEERKKKADLEALKGDTQIAERKKRMEELEEAKFIPLARTVDDEEMNQNLKAQERWNDPAAAFLSSKKAGKSVTGKPLYKGAAMPNRYGIRPGHRWDGVDRGNGFEKEWFASRNRKERNKALDYAWQMDE